MRMFSLSSVSRGGVLLIVAMLFLAFTSTNAIARKRTVTCESHDRHYHQCRAPNNGRVRLVEQLSKATCIQGSSWGYDKRGIWVDRGCRARFVVHNGHAARPSNDGGAKTLRCASDDHRYRHCRADTHRGVTLKKQLSGADCRKGYSWGYDRRGIWVDKGCDAVFLLRNRDGGGDYDDHRPGGGGWQGGGISATKRVRCASDNHRYRHCRARTGRGVRLLRKLSGADCVRGVSWGTDRRGIWVDDGCDAIFEVGGGHRDRDDDDYYSPTRNLDCSSINNQYRYCRAGRVDRAELIRQNSRKACVKGFSWGYDRKGVWVDKGCRATFRVYDYSRDR